MSGPRLTLDTNILVSALMTKETPPELILRAWKAGKFTLVSSEPQLEEFQRVLAYPKLNRYIDSVEAREFAIGLRSKAVFVDELPVVTHSSDPADNLILATAIKGQSDFLVTGDKKHLLALKTIDAVSIVTAREAVEILARTSTSYQEAP